MTTTELHRRLKALGYGLYRNPIDCHGNRWAWSTGPSNYFGKGTGTTCYFESLEAVEKYVLRVESDRKNGISGVVP